MISFKEYIKIINEDNVSGGGGVFGDGPSFGHGGDIGNEDFYNKGSAIMPFILGTKRKPRRKTKKKKKGKRK